ncbi:MAG: molybdenum cofactor biosynthesis protein MoaE, partial [Phycisphaerales bacterium]|nr:molybdenum cofactor biosynthesis protein MoaE [Phycisphaerales bacterium]
SVLLYAITLALSVSVVLWLGTAGGWMGATNLTTWVLLLSELRVFISNPSRAGFMPSSRTRLVGRRASSYTPAARGLVVCQREISLEVVVSFFGPSRDWAGVDSDRLPLHDGARLADARRAIVARRPGMAARIDRVRLAVNEDFVPGDPPLRDGDRLAVIPPVTGGGGEAPMINLVSAPIDVARLRRFMDGDASCGAVNTFDGIVRAHRDDRHGHLVRLDYEAYPEMALRQMHRIADEAMSRWPIGRLAMAHRLGPIPLGEVSVALAVACPHRRESFEACRFLIDALKRDVPIWKRDVYEDGFVEWVEPPQSHE